MSARIHYRYEGGPLDGSTRQHATLPEKPSEPALHRLTTCAKDSDIDMVAQGIYYLEQRPLPKLPIVIPNLPSPGNEWVAVHHPSEADQDWHDLKTESKTDPAPTESEAPLKPRRRVVIPEDSPAAKALAPLVTAIATSRSAKNISQP